MPSTPCPYCGHPPASDTATRCENCNGLFEPLSRTATQLAMGPWFVRDEDRPFMPGFNAEILKQQVAAGRINADTVVRGPTTHQFWMRAAEVPGLSRLLGTCHCCAAPVGKDDTVCSKCQADLSLPDTIDALGLSYVDAEARAQAQKQIATKRQAPGKTRPRPKPRPKTRNTAAAGKPIVVDPDLMQEIDDEPEETTAQSQPQESGDDAPADDELVEDVWHVSVPTSTRRRRKRKGGPDPLVLGMGVLFLVLVAIGIFVLIGQSTPPDEADNPERGGEIDTNPVPSNTRTAEQVAELGEPVVAEVRALHVEGVPAAFFEAFTAIRLLVDEAQRDSGNENYNSAYDKYARSKRLLGELQLGLLDWREKQKAEQELAAMLQHVAALRMSAAEAGAAQWASLSWTNAEATWQRALPLAGTGDIAEAEQALSEAESLFQMSLGRAETAKSAEQSRQALYSQMKAGFSEQALSEAVPALFEAFNQQKVEAERLIEAGQFEDADAAFSDAIEALTRANKGVELTKYVRFYATQAGMNAASLMLAVASGEQVDQGRLLDLSLAYEDLGLARNPAEHLPKADPLDFTAVTNAVVFDAREAIGESRGEQAQACYLVGFHMQIIAQTLDTNTLTGEQQKRVEQSLGIIEEQAGKAGWDIASLRPAIDVVREANRTATLGKDPAQLRSAWNKLMSPLSNRDNAIRVMDPGSVPSELEDPELFPGLGS